MKIQGYFIPEFSTDNFEVIRTAIFDAKTRLILRMEKKDKRSSDYNYDKKTLDILSKFLYETRDD